MQKAQTGMSRDAASMLKTFPTPLQYLYPRIIALSSWLWWLLQEVLRLVRVCAWISRACHVDCRPFCLDHLVRRLLSACGTTLLARFWHENSLTYVYLVIYSYVVVSYPYTGGTCTCLSTCWREASLGFTIFFAVPKTARQWPIDLVQR